MYENRINRTDLFNTEARLFSVVPLAWFTVLLALLYVIDDQQVYTEQLTIVASLFSLGICLSFLMIRNIPRVGPDFLDPGVLFIGFVFLTLGPVALTTAAFLVPLAQFEDQALVPLLARVTWFHLVLVISFTFTYYALARLIPPSISKDKNPDIWYSSAWMWLALALVVVSFSIEGFLGLLNTRATGGSEEISRAFNSSTGLLEGQALLHLRRMRGLSIAIAVGVFTARASTLRSAQFRLVSVTLSWSTSPLVSKYS